MGTVSLDESVILVDLEGTTKEEVLESMARNLFEQGVVKESYIDAVISREKIFPTGLPTRGCSVAIPHTDIEHVNKKSISVAVLKNTVDFGIMGEMDTYTPVKLVFMLAMDQQHAQLSLLQSLMQIFQDEEMLTLLSNEKCKNTIRELLNKKLKMEEVD